MSGAWASSLENKARLQRVTIEGIKKIAKALQVDPSELWGEELPEKDETYHHSRKAWVPGRVEFKRHLTTEERRELNRQLRDIDMKLHSCVMAAR